MKKLLLSLLATLILAGCSQIEESYTESPAEPETKEFAETAQTRAATSLLNNPYSLKKVQQAYNAVARRMGLSALLLQATDHYVKFFVADSVQYMTICDLEVELFEYPMHLELTDAEEMEYADQDPTEGMWFWTTVSPDFVFPKEIKFEKLDDIYIQRIGEAKTRAGESQMPDDVWDSVLDESLESSGYGPSTRSGSAWYPKATVRYRTDHPAYPNREFGLEGVKVRVSHGVNWAVVRTDENGSTGDIARNSGRLFKKAVNYKIKWDDKRWNIRSGRRWQAKTWGPKKSKSPWVVTFQGDGLDTKYATVHKALWNYLNENHTFYLTRDITITGINKLNTGVIDKEHPNGDTKGRFNWVNPIFSLNTINIWLKEGNGYRENWEIESTMYHELGHASHYTALRRDHGSGHNIWLMPPNDTGEPFPDFVKFCFLHSIYPNGVPNYSYSGLGESLYWQGFTPAQIEDIMCEENLTAWRRAAKNMNVTDPAIVDMLFDYFNNSQRVVRVNMTDLITGPNTPFSSTAVEYSIPEALPAGVTFRGWTVTAEIRGSFTTTGNQTHRNLNITFNAPSARYTLTANFTLPNGNAYATTKDIVTQPEITGPGYPQLHTEVQYGGIPDGATNIVWSVSPAGNCTVSGGTSGSTFKVKFTAPGGHTLTVKFKLNGESFTRTKKIVVWTWPRIVWTEFSSEDPFPSPGVQVCYSTYNPFFNDIAGAYVTPMPGTTASRASVRLGEKFTTPLSKLRGGSYTRRIATQYAISASAITPSLAASAETLEASDSSDARVDGNYIYVTFATTGRYTLSVDFTNPDDGRTITANHVIDVGIDPIAGCEITSPTNVLSNDNVPFSVSPQNGVVFDQWSVLYPTANISAPKEKSTTINFSYGGKGKYTVVASFWYNPRYYISYDVFKKIEVN